MAININITILPFIKYDNTFLLNISNIKKNKEFQ